MKIFKILFLFFAVYCLCGYDIVFDNVNTQQRRDGSQLWDIYFYATDIDSLDSLRCFLTPTLSTGETLLCETFISPSDTGYILESGYKHIIWNYGEDNPSREIYTHGIIFEILMASSNYTPGKCYPTVYIADTYNHRIVRTDEAGEDWIAFGSRGRATGEFNVPAGISVSDSGEIYIADYDNNRVIKIEDMYGAGWTTYTHFGSGEGEFDNPIDLEITHEYLYVIDYGNDRIVRMEDIDGTGWVSFGSDGSGYGHFDDPSGLAIDELGRIYIADSGNYRIVRIDDITGAGWITLGAYGDGEGAFLDPVEVDIFGDNKIYISDRGGNRIIRVDNMSGDGWYEVSDDMGLGADFTRIIGIDGTIGKGLYVLDQEGHKVVKLNLDMLMFEDSFGVPGDGVGEFNYPRAIDIKW